LAGRVSEEIYIGEIGTGAYDDFRRATGIARAMVVEYGMSEKLGPLQFGNPQGQVFLGRDLGYEQNYSDAIAYEIDKEIQWIITSCYERCKQLLHEHADKVHLIAQTLIERETLEKDEIKQLFDNGVITHSYRNVSKKEEVQPAADAEQANQVVEPQTETADVSNESQDEGSK
jgi:cell division protease FtsH